MKNCILKRFGLIFPVFVFIFATPAHADLGTPLMLFSAFHLLIGNIFIGVIEGVVIARLFQTARARSIGIMILANYTSMVLGWLIVGLTKGFVEKIADLYNIFNIVFGLFIASFILTVIIEWPFCFWILKAKAGKGGLSFRANLIAQSISYALLIPVYLLLSGNGLITNVKIDRSLSFLKENAYVYFISTKDGYIYKIKANGTRPEKVKNAGIFDKEVRLLANIENGKAGLYATGFMDKNKKGYVKRESRLLLENINRAAIIRSTPLKDAWMPYMDSETLDLRPIGQRDWIKEVSFYSQVQSGIMFKNSKQNKNIYISLSTPFLTWWISNVTILPGDQVVLQIGDNQIALLDLNSRKIGLITRGSGPLAVIEDIKQEK